MLAITPLQHVISEHARQESSTKVLGHGAQNHYVIIELVLIFYQNISSLPRASQLPLLPDNDRSMLVSNIKGIALVIIVLRKRAHDTHHTQQLITRTAELFRAPRVLILVCPPARMPG